MNKQIFLVTEEYDQIRIDKYLSDVLEGTSRSYVQKLIKDGLVTVADKMVKANAKLSGGQTVCIQIPEPVSAEIVPEAISLDILYEDEDVIIVNKPKGMVVHPSAGHMTGTLVNALMYHCRDNLSGINGVMRPGIVHRIDMNTTGALIVCKNDKSHQSIAEQLKVHSITRKYRGIVYGNLKEDEGRIEAPIGRHPVDRKKMSTKNPNGKEAVTHYHVLERFGLHTYAEFQLETGRTHQIRVHMSSIGHPLLGDDVYGPAKCPFKLQGQTLHAMVIGFIHPTSGNYVEFSAPLPEYFTTLLNKLRG